LNVRIKERSAAAAERFEIIVVELARRQFVVSPELESFSRLMKNAVISALVSVVVVVSSPPSNVDRTAGSHPLSWKADPPTAIAIKARVNLVRTLFFLIIALLPLAA